ncbi:hypothetical protein [Rhodococcus qingshengii]|uniref:hypothetical protein n=1 Tax=Rhodococcus qingshengii TaxID=334542 RepID=UPI0036FD225C
MEVPAWFPPVLKPRSRAHAARRPQPGGPGSPGEDYADQRGHDGHGAESVPVLVGADTRHPTAHMPPQSAAPGRGSVRQHVTRSAYAGPVPVCGVPRSVAR